MVKSLYFDGIDDYLQIPSIPYTKIVVIFETGSFAIGDPYKYLVRDSASWIIRNNPDDTEYITSGYALAGNGLVSGSSNNVLRGNTSYYPITITTSQLVTRSIKMFENLPAKVRWIKIYNESNLMAFYDMSKGNLQDQSGNGFHASSVGATWLEETNKYLQTDGVDDRLQAPVMDVDEIEIDFAPEFVNGVFQRYIDIGFQWVSRTDANKDEYTASYTGVYVDEVLVPNLSVWLTSGKRSTLKITRASSNAAVKFFAGGLNNYCLKAKVYGIRLLNAGVVQAVYDMTTGTVNDLSGNGRHATLTGGTWMDDGVSAGTVHEGESALSAQSNLTAEPSLIGNNQSDLSAGSNLSVVPTLIQSGEGNLSSVSSVTIEANAIRLTECLFSASSNLTVEANIIRSAETILATVSTLIGEASAVRSADISLSAISNLTAEGDKLSQDITIDLSATAGLTVNPALIQGGQASLSTSGNLATGGSLIINGESILSATSNLNAQGEVVGLEVSFDLTARSNLSAEATIVKSSETNLSAVSQLSVIGTLIKSAEGNLTAISLLSLTASVIVAGSKPIIKQIVVDGIRTLDVHLIGVRRLEITVEGRV